MGPEQHGNVMQFGNTSTRPQADSIPFSLGPLEGRNKTSILFDNTLNEWMCGECQ